MEFNEVVKRRYSCRRYTDRPVEREKLTACLEAGRISPSSCNSQRWVFIAVDRPEPRAAVAKALEGPELGINLFTGQIPAFIVIVRHPPRRLNEKQKIILDAVDHSLIDIGAAAQQICLTATDLGLGSILLGWFDGEQIGRALGIPEELEVALVIGLGYAQNDAARRPTRYPADEIIRWNGFAKSEPPTPADEEEATSP